MKYVILIFTAFLSATALISCGQNNTDRIILGREYAQEQIIKVLSNKTNQSFYDILITNKQLAISIAEPILFNIYGKKQILKERPYECYLIEGFWYISGTIPKGWKGGGFEIIINAKNAQIIKLTHYK